MNEQEQSAGHGKGDWNEEARVGEPDSQAAYQRSNESPEEKQDLKSWSWPIEAMLCPKEYSPEWPERVEDAREEALQLNVVVEASASVAMETELKVRTYKGQKLAPNPNLHGDCGQLGISWDDGTANEDSEGHEAAHEDPDFPRTPIRI